MYMDPFEADTFEHAAFCSVADYGYAHDGVARSLSARCRLYGPHNVSVHNTARIHSPSGTPYVINGYATQSTEHEAELTVHFAGHGVSPCESTFDRTV
jgi:hypothetical protein